METGKCAEQKEATVTEHPPRQEMMMARLGGLGWCRGDEISIHMFI